MRFTRMLVLAVVVALAAAVALAPLSEAGSGPAASDAKKKKKKKCKTGYVKKTVKKKNGKRVKKCVKKKKKKKDAGSAGTYSGNTNQGLPFTLTVSSKGKAKLSIQITYDCIGSPPKTGPWTGDGAVENGRLSGKLTAPPGEQQSARERPEFEGTVKNGKLSGKTFGRTPFCSVNGVTFSDSL